MKNIGKQTFTCLLLAWQMYSGYAQEFQLERTLQGHEGQVQNIRFSPNGKMIAGGGSDGQIILWDVATGRVLRKMKGHTKTVYEVTFNKDGSLLASAGEDGIACVWEVATGKNIGCFQNKPFPIFSGILKQDLVSVSFVVFSPNSRYIYFSGDNGYIMKADIKTGVPGKIQPAEMIHSTNEPSGRWYSTVTGGTVSQDEKYLVVTVGNLVKFIDLNDGLMVRYFRYEGNYLNDVVNGPFPNSIATWSYDGKVTIWNATNGRILSSFQVSDPENYSGASFSRDGKLMVTAAYGTSVRVWDLTNGKLIATLGGHRQIVRMARFSPTEDLIASGSYDGSVKLWRMKKPEPEEPVIAKKTEPTPPKPDAKPNNEPERATENKSDNSSTNKDNNSGIVFKNEKVEVGKTIQLSNILFEQSSFVLRRESYAELDKLVAFLKENPNVVIELRGHTDNVGNPQKNQTLSERRVAAVKNYLTQRGISEDRILTAAFGGSQPIADNSTEAGRQKNRRVEMKILKL
ncbi:MAG: OmpA family protein [Cytophagales bacterium]|nr:OmpA family protein [Bernardetiaceae bacterium]MDW8204794.1 OmpA family protein [Cytophagales bacterium]